MILKPGRLSLTDDEATLLSLVVRGEPLTAYQIAKIYEASPVSNFRTSTGKIYPMIRRLRRAGYLTAKTVEGDARGTEQLSITDSGRQAVRTWIMEIRPNHLLPEDPLRTKVQSFALLSREERLEWISELKLQMLEKLSVLEEYGRDTAGSFEDLVHDNAVKSVRSRMDWLDLVLKSIVQQREMD